METLLKHLDLLAKSQVERLMALCGVDREDLSDMIAEVRALTPKPGAAFGGGAVQSVAPDVYVKQAPDGSWVVELNTDSLPKVLMNQRYYATVSKSAKREEDKQFVAECAANASWLVKSLDQRARTILKVAREIVRQQDGFFAHGVAHLRPLNLKTVATAIEMHESTVSRVTSNKYLSCARGVFELKYFFTASIAATGSGEAHSAEAVRYQIKELIGAEGAREILSDDRIVEILRERGIDIARRTVAKYRESLRIPSSVERKRKLAQGL
jgi:RNA polymerase sigma-54 factor